MLTIVASVNKTVEELSVVKSNIVAIGALCSLMMVVSVHVRAQVCASGIYRAGCAGPNGAVVVARPPSPYFYHPAAPYYGAATPYYRAGRGVHCAAGVYRAGCVGRRGAVAVRRPY